MRVAFHEQSLPSEDAGLHTEHVPPDKEYAQDPFVHWENRMVMAELLVRLKEEDPAKEAHEENEQIRQGKIPNSVMEIILSFVAVCLDVS
nr:hypothetical protein Iba_chr02cCG10010 [Ipomoea batatas]